MRPHLRIPKAATAAQPRRERVIASMQLTTTGKQIEIGEALRRHIEATLASTLEKYFKTAIEAHVVVSREAHLTRAEVSIHIGRGIVVNAHAAAAEAYAAFDAAADHMAKQLRRYKRRLRDYHAKTRPILELFRRKELVVVVDGTRLADDVQQDLRRQLGLQTAGGVGG